MLTKDDSDVRPSVFTIHSLAHNFSSCSRELDKEPQAFLARARARFAAFNMRAGAAELTAKLILPIYV